jgi:hypothetical protein
MATNKFTSKIADAKQVNVTYEDMKNPKAEIDSFESQEVETETIDPEFEQKEEILQENEPGTIDLKDYIPRSEFNETLQREFDKRWEEKLKLTAATEVSSPVKREEPVNKKVEAEDDLPEFKNWEVKDRIYVLCTGYSSLSQGIKDRHKKNSPLMYKGRSLRYSSSQASFFMDKQTGDVLLTYLSIENGRLMVPKENIHLQKFLAIHPDNGVVFKEHNPKQESKAAYDAQNLKIDAHILSKNIDIQTLVAIGMLMIRDYTEDMDLVTIKRHLYDEIEANPTLFIKLASDKMLKMKSIGRIAVFRGLLSFNDFKFYDENNNLLIQVARNENEYDVLASYFASFEGRGLYNYLKQKTETAMSKN